jgi:hypothetical protein
MRAERSILDRIAVSCVLKWLAERPCALGGLNLGGQRLVQGRDVQEGGVERFC